MGDYISREAAIDALCELPSAEPTLNGYNINHLKLIAEVLQKENLPPERLLEVLTDIGKIVALVVDEFNETLQRTVGEQWNIMILGPGRESSGRSIS